MNNMRPICYQLSAADYLEASHLHKRHSKDFYLNIFIIILLLYSSVLSFYRIIHPDLAYWRDWIQSSGHSLEELKQAEITSTTLFLLTFLLSLSTTFPKLSPLSRWLNRQNIKKNFIKQESKQIEISSNALTITSQNYRETRQWQDFERMLENKKIFLLYHSRNSECTIIPKYIFTRESEIKYFRDLLNNR